MRTLVNSLTQWDVLFLTRIIGLEGRKLFSVVIPWISHSGNGYYYPLLPFLIYIVRPDLALPFFYAALAAYAIELPVYKLLKNLVKRDRPCEALANVRKRISPSDRFSFPSGHTAAAFVMVTIVAHFFPMLILPAVCWALLVGLSRVYLGVHYPTDILAGMVLGMVCGCCGLIIGG
jgi:undecaprenyl-diphosphatase